MNGNDEEINDSGFQAIMDKCTALYGEDKGTFWGVQLPYVLGGPDPLDQIAVFESDKGVPHWHFVTFGFSELYEKESDNKEFSGFGFELTFRLKRGNEEAPPVWAANFLQNLARYVFKSGNCFDKNQHMDINGPIALEEDTKIVAIAFDIDSELGGMDTPNGHVDFIQVIGITADELDGMMLWNGEKFLKLFKSINPMGITILGRDSYLDNPKIKSALLKGVEEDGSSTGMLYVDEVKMEILDVEEKKIAALTIGAGHILKAANMVKARLSKGNSLYLHTADLTVGFEISDIPGFGYEEGFGMLKFDEKCLEEFMALQPKAGKVLFKSMPLLINVVPTLIKDGEGNIIKTIE